MKLYILDERDVWHAALADAAREVGLDPVRIRRGREVKTGGLGFIRPHATPSVSPKETTRLGYRGSDQAWLTACLQHCSGKWGEADGCYDYSGLRKPGMGMRASGSARRRVALPTDARIVFFHGKPDPWEVSDQWVLDNYK